MGFDLVTWSPRISSSGDDAYNIPGSTKLDGSFDSVNPPSKIIAGPSTYSNIPTTAEINAGSGINQIIAAVRQRWLQQNAIEAASGNGSVPPFTVAYISPGVKVNHTHITTLQSVIQTQRRREGFDYDTSKLVDGNIWPNIFTGTQSSYAFPVAPVAGQKILGSHFAALRKALRISGKAIRLSAQFTGQIVDFVRSDNPFNTKLSESISKNTFVGSIRITFSGTQATRTREAMDILVPNYVSGNVAPSMTISLFFTTFSVVNGANFQVFWCDSPTDDFASNSPSRMYPAASMASYPGSSLAVGKQAVLNALLANTSYAARAGGHYSSVLLIDKDFLNVNPGGVNTGYEDGYAAVDPGIMIDYGA